MLKKHLFLFHYYVILPHKVKRTRKIRGRNQFNQFTTGRIPVDAKGAFALNEHVLDTLTRK